MRCDYFYSCRYIQSLHKKYIEMGFDKIIVKQKNNMKFNIFDIYSYIYKIVHVFNNSNKNRKEYPKKNQPFFIILSIIIIFSVWLMSGLYTIKEAERGVILRFGKYHHLVHPGLNWKPTFVDIMIPVNVESVRELAASGMMLTSDENVVRVEMNVQYRVTNPKNYLFNVTNADDSLRQATDSALRGVIGKYNMDRILTEGRTVVRSDTRRILEKTIQPYNMGISLLDVNFQTARPPEEVKAAFDDAIAARENEQQYIREAEAYANEVQPRANGQAQRVLEEGRAYKSRTILEAQGEVQRFSKILPEYKAAPEITRERLYINSMERVFSNTRKVFIDSKNTQNMLLFSSDQIIPTKKKKNIIKYSDTDISNIKNKDTDLKNVCASLNSSNNQSSSYKLKDTMSSYDNDSDSTEELLNQRKANTKRINIVRNGRGEL